MWKASALLILGSMAAFAAQQPAAGAGRPGTPSAPPEVDRALRERVTKFLQAHVDGKFRQAEQYVAEDSKDVYYSAEKPRYLKFEIARIKYAENFTKATVVANCERELKNQFGTYAMNVPQESDWKLENGQWSWWVDPDVIRLPFGETRRKSEMPANASAKAGESLTRKGPSVADVLKKMSDSVKADKTQVSLSAASPSAEVVISNSMPGAVSLKVTDPKVEGLSVKLEKEQVTPQSTSRVLFRYKPQAKTPQAVLVSVLVQPTGQAIPIQVQFSGK